MSFLEKNEENLEALIYSLTQRDKTTIAIGMYDCDDTREKAIAHIAKQRKGQKTFYFDFFGKKIDSLLAFLRENLPEHEASDLPLVHITRLDPLLFVSENHKVISSPLVAQINMERELLFHEVKAHVVLWITRDGYNRMRIDAPDFMDWVVASFVFENDGEASVPQLSFDIPRETLNDKSKASVYQLKIKAEQLERKTVKFEQGAKSTIKEKKEYFNLLLALIDVYVNMHDLAHAQKTLWKTYNLAKDNNLAQGYEFGKLLINWGDTETNLGNLEKAFQLYEEALMHFELLKDTHNISVCLERLGDTHTTLGNQDKALQYFEDETKLSKELYESNPQHADFKYGLAVSYLKFGDTYTSLGNQDKALTYFEDYHKLMIELYESNPQHEEFKNGLAISYEKLGNSHTSLGNLDKALKYFENFHKLMLELYESDPQHVGFKNNLLVSYSKLGNTQTSLGNLDKALEYFEDETKLSNDFYELYPQHVEFKNGLAVSYLKLGDTHSSLGNLDKSLQYFEDFHKLMIELYESNPQHVVFKNGLAISYEKLGNTHTSLGNLDKALKYFEEYSRLGLELYESNPQHVGFKNGLAIAYIKLGTLYIDKLDNRSKGIDFLSEAKILLQDLKEDFPMYKEFERNFNWVVEKIDSGS